MSEEDTIEEYAKYFPQFVWVLRDFSLQLIDEYGDEITSNQYLENALEHQDGFGPEVEFKNKIRHLIKCFFQKRSCFTLVRPLTSEDGLNRLNDCKMENLRPEFVEEALKLRNSMLLNAKVKTMEGKQVNGEILANVLRAYIETINNGVIPNIENTWNYVTQSQATKLLEGCIQEFKSMVASKIKKIIPVEEGVLKENIKEFKMRVFRTFNENSFLSAEENSLFEKTLGEKIKEEKKNVILENDFQFEELLSNAMNNNFKENIYGSVVNEKFADSKELVAALKNFKATFEGIEPDGPKKLERLYKFLFAKSCESFAIMFSHQHSKLNDKIAEKNREFRAVQEALDEELKKLGEIKSRNEGELKAFEAKVHDLNFENEKLKESLKFVREEIAQAELESNSRREDEKNIYKKRQDDLLKKLDENQKNYKILENNFVKQKSDFQIELALLNQKIEFYANIEKDLNEQKAKLQNRQKQLEEEFNGRLAKATADFELRIKDKNEEIARLRENKMAIEDELKHKQTYNESICSEFVDKEDELRGVIAVHEKTINGLKEKVQNCENLTVAQTHQEQQLLEKIQKLETTIRNFDEKSREKDEKITQLSTSLDTKLAVENQKIQFLEIKINELTIENDDFKKRKDSSFQMLEMKNLPKIDLNQQLQEVRSNYEERLKKVTADFDAEKDDIGKGHAKTIEEFEEKIKELKTEKETLFAAKLNLSQANESIRQKLKNLEEKLGFLESSQNQTVQEKFQFFENQIKKLNEEKDNIIFEKNEDSEKNKRAFEENLANMQLVFDGERSRLDKKLAEEKTKFEHILNEHIEEFERKKNEEIAQLEEENMMLGNELQNLDQKSKTVVQKLEGEISSLKTKLEAADKKITDLTGTIDRELANEKNKLKYTLANFEQERNLFNEKYNSAKNELTAKNLELFQLKQQSESQNATLAKNLADKVKELEDLNSEVNDAKNRLETAQTEKQQINEELVNTKINLNKELALKSQKLEFLENKIADLTNANDSIQKDADEKIKTVKNEAENEKEQLQKSKKEEIALWENRYEEKKKSMKEVEAIFTNKIAELEKMKYILHEKFTTADQKRDELEKKCQIDSLKFEGDLKKLKESYMSERKEIIAEIELLRKEKYDLEILLAETHAKLDKDKAVFESKVAFLEQQNRKLKNDLTESQNSFDSMFQKFHQFRVSDKEETETSHTTYIISLEQRYNAQIQDLKDQHKSMVDSFKEKIRTYEKEIKRLEQVNFEHMNNRYGSGVFQEKKISEMLENEKQLQDELIRVRSLAEKNNMQIQREFDKEREAFKKKLLDQELRLKKLETEKNLMIFEQEKQKTKWNIEKDHLISSKTEFLESLDRVKKQKEQLARENEKLKTDLRMVKKTTLGNSLFTFVKNKSDVFSGEKSQKSSKDYTGQTQQYKEESRENSDIE